MKKLTKLDKTYEEIDKTYGEATEEQMQEAIENLKKEIDGKKDTLAITEEGEKGDALKANIEALEKRLNNLKGYSKNKVQIERIKQYRGTLEQKLQVEIEKKETHKNNLKTLVPELEEVIKKLKDEKYTMTLDQYEYNSLLEKRETLFKAVKDNRDGQELSSKRIMELKAKIGKCNLAWKTLFVNKDWDEIQRRAMSDEKRFTRRVDEKNPPIKGDNEERTTSKIDRNDFDNIEREVAESARRMMEEEENKKAKENGDSSAPPAPISRWTKIKNFFRSIPSRLKATFGKEDKSSESEKDNSQESKTEARDQFLEGLRQYADTEYRQQVRQKKEKAYMEAHKVKPEEQGKKEILEQEK